MLHKQIIPYMLLATCFFCSCGTNKKLQTAQTQIDDLQSRNNQLQQTVNSLKKEVGELSTRNQAMAEDYTRYKAKCDATTEKYTTLKAALDEEAKDLDRLEEKLVAALVDFESRGVDVYSKDGHIYVSMEDDLLYKSGSAKLGVEGEKALGNLASVLKDYPKLKVVVIGNTDDTHVSGTKDNWSLSTERANGVVRLLRDKYSLDPARLTAAGNGKYNPVADNSTAEGRAKNRRIDIILNPDLEKIWDDAKKE